MNAIKTIFSIKDLENLSGIKAHTIRIWEKRYGVLAPMRTDTNIRAYDITNLQKLLNICLLIEYGYKISRISSLSQEKITELINEISSNKNVKNQAISALKIAMFNFDQNAFLKIYSNLLRTKKFEEVFFEVFIPLLNELGLLWQTNTISPAHEHFITYLIKQKLLLTIETLQANTPKKTEPIFVLFLPPNEIHELGLLYLNYEILRNGYKTIFLGASIPTESLLDVKKYFKNITFVTYCTVEPSPNEINDYLNNVNQLLLNNSNSNLFVFGKMIEYINKEKLPKKISIFNSIDQLTEILQNES
jgi:DNA-binding transcriptional MerR regulator